MRPDPLSPEFEETIKAAASKASKEQIEASLIYASAEVDRICNFKGRKANPRQSMAWPRLGVTDEQGKPVTGVPKAIEDATCFLSAAHLAGYTIGPHNRELSIGLVAAVLLRVDALVDPENPTNNVALQ